MTGERKKQMPISLREIHGAKERLTEPQKRVLAVLFANYTVCASHSLSIPHYDRVLIGNGSRLSLVTMESLL